MYWTRRQAIWTTIGIALAILILAGTIAGLWAYGAFTQHNAQTGASHQNAQARSQDATSTGTPTATPTPGQPVATSTTLGGAPSASQGPIARTPAGGLIDPRSVNTHDPAAVARAVAATINRYDTAIDTSSLDALQRAAPWLSPELLADSLAVPPGSNAEWAQLAAHHGYTTVDDLAPANETGQPTTIQQVSYRAQQHGRDGWRSTATTPSLLRMQMVRTPSGSWQVIGFGTP